MSELFDEDVVRRITHRNDPETSRQSAEWFAARLSERQAEVLAYARSRGAVPFTQDDVGEHYGAGYSTHRSRVHELQKLGWLIDTGQRKINPKTGRNVTLWLHRDFWTGPLPELRDSAKPKKWTADQERAAVVAWLRAARITPWNAAADAIERGDHREEGK